MHLLNKDIFNLEEASMKKTVVVYFTFVIFVLLSGCSKSEEEKCKEKGTTWYWDKSAKECKEKTPEGAAGNAGGAAGNAGGAAGNAGGAAGNAGGAAGNAGGAAGNAGGATGSEVETQESCTSKQGYMWDIESSQCKKPDGDFMLIYPKRPKSEFFHINVLLPGNDGFLLDRFGSCTIISQSILPDITITVDKHSISQSIYNKKVCSNTNPEVEVNCKPGVYTIIENNDGTFSLQSVTLDEERTDCYRPSRKL